MKRHNARVILVDGKPGSLKATRDALHKAGFRKLHVTATIIEARVCIDAVGCDVLICDTETGSGEAVALFTDIRQGDLGSDQFLPVIATK